MLHRVLALHGDLLDIARHEQLFKPLIAIQYRPAKRHETCPLTSPVCKGLLHLLKSEIEVSKANGFGFETIPGKNAAILYFPGVRE